MFFSIVIFPKSLYCDFIKYLQIHKFFESHLFIFIYPFRYLFIQVAVWCNIFQIKKKIIITNNTRFCDTLFRKRKNSTSHENYIVWHIHQIRNCSVSKETFSHKSLFVSSSIFSHIMQLELSFDNEWLKNNLLKICEIICISEKMQQIYLLEIFRQWQVCHLRVSTYMNALKFYFKR